MTTTTTDNTTNTTAIGDRYPSRKGRPPELIPRGDPTTIPGVSGPLDDDEVAAYDRDGYVIVPDLFDPSEVDALDRALTARMEAEAHTERVVVEPDSGEARSIFAFHERGDTLGKVVADPRLAGVARQLLGSEVYVHQSRVNRKPGFRGRDFQWHSDFETWHTEDGMPGMRCVSATVWLTENLAWNGSLLVMPGSHRWFVTCTEPTPPANHRSSLRAQMAGVPDEDSLRRLYEECGLVPCQGAPGSVLFFDCNLMHGSPSNISPLPRRNLFVVYNSVHNALRQPYSADAPRPDHLASRSIAPV